jgi:hypothetical protein
MPLPSRLPEAAVTIFYLHGFASSPKSTKAQYFAERLAAHGVSLICPDFNQPEFRTMTITRMLEQLEAGIARHCQPGQPGEPVTLFGSSLGGTLAILAGERLGPAVDRLVLMAPAVMFAKPGHHLLPPERIDQWRRAGALAFFHHGDNEERLLDFAFYEDTLRYDAFDACVRQPAMIFQGLRDASVDYRTVEQFARTRPNVTLSLLDDDHQLTASLPRMWESVREFLGLNA